MQGVYIYTLTMSECKQIHSKLMILEVCAVAFLNIYGKFSTQNSTILSDKINSDLINSKLISFSA